jgi:hypothetical protein
MVSTSLSPVPSCRPTPCTRCPTRNCWRPMSKPADNSWKRTTHPHVVYAHPGTVGAAAKLPKAPGSQKRLSEDLPSVRLTRANMPAAIVATQSVRHRSPVAEGRPNVSGPNRCEEVPEMHKIHVDHRKHFEDAAQGVEGISRRPRLRGNGLRQPQHL